MNGLLAENERLRRLVDRLALDMRTIEGYSRRPALFVCIGEIARCAIAASDEVLSRPPGNVDES